jgi:hypothetical protein
MKPEKSTLGRQKFKNFRSELIGPQKIGMERINYFDERMLGRRIMHRGNTTKSTFGHSTRVKMNWETPMAETVQHDLVSDRGKTP